MVLLTLTLVGVLIVAATLTVTSVSDDVWCALWPMAVGVVDACGTWCTSSGSEPA